MQKLNDFVGFYEGKKVDFDGAYGAQCVDLFRQYNKEVYNLPHTGVVNGAKDLFLQYDNLPVEKRYYEKISKEVKPIPGDVVIFGESKTNEFGHVAIVLYATKKSLIVFEQDGFKQDGAKIATWNYDRVLGYLRRREN